MVVAVVVAVVAGEGTLKASAAVVEGSAVATDDDSDESVGWIAGSSHPRGSPASSAAGGCVSELLTVRTAAGNGGGPCRVSSDPG